VTARAALAAGLVALATAAAAHVIAPDTILGDLNSEQTRVTQGVVRAERSPHNRRLLVVRVGPGWYGLPAASRQALARQWQADWRRSVEAGIVAVLDDRSDAPVVQFRPGGGVGRVSGPPPP
jgi:hypothetical protein